MKIYLILSAISWLGYGLYCLAFPEVLTELAGLSTLSVTATTELRAMYGGLQASIGVMAAWGLFKPARQHAAMLTLALVYTGLFSGRLCGAIVVSDLSDYTLLGLGFEGVFATWGWLLIRKNQA